MKQFLQTTDRLVWESVDEYTFKNRDLALDEKGVPRYTGNYIITTNDGSVHDLHCTGLTSQELSIVMRLLAIQPHTGSVPGGWLREPIAIVFKPKNPRQSQIIRMADGSVYKKVA